MSEMISHDAGGRPPEALGRRALGLDAAWCGLVGTTALATGGRIGRAVGLPGWAVRLAGAGVVGWGVAVGLWSVGEDWTTPTRRVLGANVVGTAALVGHATARGSRAGRIGVLVTAAQVAGFAYAQARALIAAEPHPDMPHPDDPPPADPPPADPPPADPPPADPHREQPAP